MSTKNKTITPLPENDPRIEELIRIFAERWQASSTLYEQQQLITVNHYNIELVTRVITDFYRQITAHPKRPTYLKWEVASVVVWKMRNYNNMVFNFKDKYDRDEWKFFYRRAFVKSLFLALLGCDLNQMSRSDHDFIYTILFDESATFEDVKLLSMIVLQMFS